ncbi:MAG: 5'/3'-nucleotidase SurE [Eubacteriales bacterium]
MKILVTNDDGINAEGLRNLVEVLKDKAEIYISAPDGQRSAASHSISLHNPIMAKEVKYEGAVRAFSVSGTPADCVKVGLRILLSDGIDIDMVFSGINHGANMGMDTHYSGTVSAAMEAAICGVLGVAVSIDTMKKVPDYFDAANYVVEKTFDKICEERKRLGIAVLSINIPDIPKKDLKGIKQTELGIRDYSGWFEPPIKNDDGDWQFKYNGLPQKDLSVEKNYDTIAVESGYASITPLRVNFTHRELLDDIMDWEIL